MSFGKFLRITLVASALTAATLLGASASSVGIGTVNNNGLRLRSAANTSSPVLTSASQGDLVVVMEDLGDGWLKVDYGSEIGYMSGEYLTVSAQADVNLGFGLVQSEGSTLNLRSGPGVDYDLVTALSDETVVQLMGMDNGWFKVNYNGVEGYASSDYILTCLDENGTRRDRQSSVSSAGQAVVEYAKTFLGRPYVWGGNGPKSFDCSGFTKYVYNYFGYSLNRTASGQLQNGVAINPTRGSWAELQPGDLVFFYNGRVSTPVSHVGIYVGDGVFIHASTNTYAVQFDSLYSSYYSSTFRYARRIL